MANTAAWLTAPKMRPFEVKEASLGTPEQGQILIKNRAIAINPIDGKLQAMAIYPINYPAILGQDVAGEVVSVGPDVTRFKKGDRVLGTAAGFATKRDEDKAFQAYTILETDLTSEIPDDVSYERAVVLPLGLTTASAGLFHPEQLNLDLPTEPARKPNGKILLVWGGASSVGGNAIQLAVASGYEVITTASPKNFEYVKNLGASHVFDYNSPTVVSDLVHVTQGKISAGVLDAVGGSSWAPSIDFLQKVEGTKFISSAIRGFPDPPEGISIKQMYSLSIRENHVGRAIYQDFLPKSLKNKSFVTAPKPLVVGTGLESIQAAVDRVREGLSAQKAVVLL